MRSGVTLNNEKDLASWDKKQRDDVPPETLLEEYTTPQSDDGESETATGGLVLDDEPTTLSSPPEDSDIPAKEDRKGLPSLAFASSNASADANGTAATEAPSNNASSVEGIVAEGSSKADAKVEKKAPGPETFTPVVDVYEFNEPFLWFLHAINEEPMFMGVIESFKRYLEETGNKDNNVGNKVSGVIEKNGWIYEAARGILWHCPSMINKQAE